MNCCGKRFGKLVKEVFIWNIREKNGRKMEENMKKLRYWHILWINMIYRIVVLEVKLFVRFFILGKKIEVRHVNRDDAHFLRCSELRVKGKWFSPKVYTCYILPILSMIVMKVVKLYIFYAYLVISVHISLHRWLWYFI